MTREVKSRILRAVAHAVAVGSPLTATLSYFPLWHKMGGEHLLSGVALTFAIISFLPLLREIKRHATPSAPVIWLALFLLFFGVSRIADEVCVITLVGFISSLVAALIFKLSERVGGK